MSQPKKQPGVEIEPAGDHHLHPYPVSIPSDLFTRLIEIFRGSPIAVEDAHRLWHIAGYGLSQFDPHDPLVMGTAPLTKEQVADQIEAALNYKKSGIAAGEAEAFAALPWKAMLALVLQFLQSLLS